MKEYRVSKFRTRKGKKMKWYELTKKEARQERKQSIEIGRRNSKPK